MSNLVYIPKLNSNDHDVVIFRWLVKAGESVHQNQDLCEIQTSKAIVIMNAPTAGYIFYINKENERLKVGQLLASIGTSALQAEDDYKKNQIGKELQKGNTEKKGNTRFSRAAEQMIVDKKLNREQFSDIRLVTTDVIEKKIGIVDTRTSRNVQSNPQEEDSYKIISPAKQAEINNLGNGQNMGMNSTLNCFLHSEKIRNNKRYASFSGAPILSIVLYELSKLLKTPSNYLAYFNEDRIIFHEKMNFGIAIDLGSGVQTITISEIENLKLEEINEKIIEITLRLAKKSLSISDIQSNSITITDLSSYNILYFNPILNKNQSMILGIGGDVSLPGAPISLNLTYDHRVLSGREVAILLKKLKEQIETHGETN